MTLIPSFTAVASDMEYAVEWDYDALYRKYYGVVCYLFHVAENREYIAYVHDMKRRTHPESDNEISPCIVYHILAPNAEYGPEKKGHVVVSSVPTWVEDPHPEIKLRPLAIKPRVIQSRAEPGNITLFSRMRRKSYKCGISSENFHVLKLRSAKPEHLDTGNILYPKATFTKIDDLEVLDPAIYVDNGDIYVYDVHVGFAKGKVAKISNKAVRKLFAEKVPTWQVQSL